jgi:hypothetical protein
MGAKAKLNSAFFNGAVVIAGLVGWLAGSWLVFLIALAILLLGSVYAGNIRK